MMTTPLVDAKALEAATDAFRSAGGPSSVMFVMALEDGLRAYLAATASPEVKELGAGAAFVAAVVMLARHGIPGDIQELLIRGNPDLGIAPNALIDAIDAFRNAMPEVKETVTSTEAVLKTLGTLTGPLGAVTKVAVWIDAAASSLEASEARAAVLQHTIDQLHGPLSIAALEARADEAEARAAGLEKERDEAWAEFGDGFRTEDRTLAVHIKAALDELAALADSERARAEAAESALLTSDRDLKEALRKLELAREAAEPLRKWLKLWNAVCSFANRDDREVPDWTEVRAIIPGGERFATADAWDAYTKQTLMHLVETFLPSLPASRALNGEGEKN
jgi:hypothetical protein